MARRNVMKSWNVYGERFHFIFLHFPSFLWTPLLNFHLTSCSLYLCIYVCAFSFCELCQCWLQTGSNMEVKLNSAL